MTDDLIARLEAATGPSRELDAAVAVATFKAVDTGDDLIYRLLPIREEQCATGTFWHVSRSGRSLHAAPYYTASLDAALTLVPEGLCWGLNTHPVDEIFNPGGAQAFVSDMLEDGIYAHADSATPALALCVAALKARRA